jgi:hypothetical protein
MAFTSGSALQLQVTAMSDTIVTTPTHLVDVFVANGVTGTATAL